MIAQPVDEISAIFVKQWCKALVQKASEITVALTQQRTLCCVIQTASNIELDYLCFLLRCCHDLVVSKMGEKTLDSRPVLSTRSQETNMLRLRYANPTTIPKSLRCSICLEPFFQPIRTPCGHVFCKECLDAWVQKKPSCPLDAQPLPSAGPFQVDYVLSELFAEFPILCPNECPWTGLQRDVTSHLLTCPTQNVSCSNLGCTEVLPRKEIAKHQESCPHRANNNAVVALNVGGKKFQTLRATLTKHQDTYFTRLFNGEIPAHLDSEGNYFIDRDGELFACVLEGLRTDHWNTPTQDALQKELEFYGLNPLPQRQLSIAEEVKPPPYWSSLDSLSCKEFQLASGSDEWVRIHRLLIDTMAPYHKTQSAVTFDTFELTKVVRVQNPTSWLRYQAHKDEIVTQCGSTASPIPNVLTRPPLDATVNEYHLFHGLNSKFIPHIKKLGFNTNGSSLTGMFGAGLYFYENSSKANQYSHAEECATSGPNPPNCTCKKDDEMCMLLCRVILGDALIEQNFRGNAPGQFWHARRTAPIKPGGSCYHSVVGESKENYPAAALLLREYVIYECGQVYPEYVIFYKRS